MPSLARPEMLVPEVFLVVVNNNFQSMINYLSVPQSLLKLLLYFHARASQLVDTQELLE